MKILVFGNVGSGKTTLLNKLKEVLPWQIITIDDFRRKHGNGSKEKELIAQKHFFEAINTNENQFIECIGVGKVSEELFSFLCKTDEKLICLKLIAPKEICRKRLEKRIWNIPFPAPLEKVNPLIDRTEERINGGGIEILWSKRNNTTIISKENIYFADIDEIVNEVIKLLEQHDSIVPTNMNEIKMMLNESIQDYYSNEYMSYQKGVIDKNDTYLEDRLMISNFISELNLNGNLVDIGSGNCQWFHYFENTINHYYAIETNKIALSLAPKAKKLTTINQNVFDKKFELAKAIPSKIDYAFFSFFFSHFSDSSISGVFNKLVGVNSFLIVDTLWSEKHKLKYSTKELRNVRRKISKSSYIELPKRFFEFSDLEKIGTTFNFKITNFVEGNYWFACKMQK